LLNQKIACGHNKRDLDTLTDEQHKTQELTSKFF